MNADTEPSLAERPYGPGGAEQRRGLRLFNPGAKVWVPDGFAGMGYENVTVIGQTRKSRRYAIVNVATEHLTNWRVKLVYSPAVLDRINEVCWSPAIGFSRHGDDRSSEAYRDDLQRAAARFQQHTDEIHRTWQLRRAGIGDTATPEASNRRARWMAWVAGVLSRMRSLR